MRGATGSTGNRLMTAVSTSAPTECAVVILTMNEEDNIGAVLDSVSGWAAQAYVVDSGSTDKTVEVAERHGATVLHHCAPGAFVITDQRNWSIEALAPTDDWVLFLDADERATPEFLRAVETATRDDGLDGYYAAPRFIYQGTWLRRFMGYPNWHPRLVQTSRCRLIGGVWEDFPRQPVSGTSRSPICTSRIRRGSLNGSNGMCAMRCGRRVRTLRRRGIGGPAFGLRREWPGRPDRLRHSRIICC